MSMNNSLTYNYREEKRATYTSPQYEDVVKKYMNYDPSQQRSTLAINQGISEQNNFSKSVAYQPYDPNAGTGAGDTYGYKSVQYQTNYGNSGNYQDRFSNLQNVQIKEVQSPDRQYYSSDLYEDNDRVKKSKKHQEVTITNTTTTYDMNGVQEYQPMLVGNGKSSYSASNNHLIRTNPSQVVILENTDLAVSQRLSNTNPRLHYQNQTESRSIQDQNIALCNIF